MHRLWLIAQREFAAYAGVPSFWVALLLGPVLMLLTGLASAAARPPAPPPAQVVAIEAERPALAAAAIRALADAGPLRGRPFEVVPAGRQGADTRVGLTATADGGAAVRIQGQALGPAAETLLRRDLTAALKDERLGAPADRVAPDAVRIEAPKAPEPKPFDTAKIGRFALMMLLWLNLVGALGMLLQAVVRERANRALESLLASVRPGEIAFGKLAGVGALSVLVLGAWLAAGAAVAASPVGAASGGISAMLFGAFTRTEGLLTAAAVYVLTFAMYGAAMIGIGALARDIPSAQNLSRPMFGVLLLVFFTALAQLGGEGAMPAWLAWLPPFTPFVVLTSAPGAIAPAQLAAAFASMALTTLAAGWFAARAVAGKGFRIGRRTAAPLAA